MRQKVPRQIVSKRDSAYVKNFSPDAGCGGLVAMNCAANQKS
jgi:hypothetical protein